MLDIIIIMNNYFHDLATAVLFSSGLLMLTLYQVLRRNKNPERVRFFKEIYNNYTLVAKASLTWVILAGIPRVIYFKKIEWTIALDNRIIPALMVKHIFMFSLAIIGGWLWYKLGVWTANLPEED